MSKLLIEVMFYIDGDIDAVERAEALLQRLMKKQKFPTNQCRSVTFDDSRFRLIVISWLTKKEHDAMDVWFQTRKGRINPRGANQKRYVQRILQSDISFGIGPAGTGKTYLAVAAAVDMLERNEIQRILLVRPAVEAGEKLGFLPGDLTRKSTHIYVHFTMPCMKCWALKK
jgi:phosphate starvation-inducible PhoH-like protein